MSERNAMTATLTRDQDVSALGDSPELAELRQNLEAAAELRAEVQRRIEAMPGRRRELNRDLGSSDEAERDQARVDLAVLGAEIAVLPDEAVAAAETYARALHRWAAHVLPATKALRAELLSKQDQIARNMRIVPYSRGDTRKGRARIKETEAHNATVRVQLQPLKVQDRKAERARPRGLPALPPCVRQGEREHNEGRTPDARRRASRLRELAEGRPRRSPRGAGRPMIQRVCNRHGRIGCGCRSRRAWANTPKRTLPRNWQRLRRTVLRRDPVCTICHAAPSTEVHHTDHRDDHRLEVLAGVCKPCHASETAGQGVAARSAVRGGGGAG